MDGQESIFEYMYRDGGNFKTFGQLRLTGWDGQGDAKIRLCLEADGQFVSEQIGVPSLCREHWEAVEDSPSELDHAFHEFVCLRQPKGAEGDLPVWGSLDTMLARMEGAAWRWNVRLSPNCDL